MSTSNNEEQPGRFSFQHFDQECDFGVDNEEGERVRKRKRPGRKPNPPSLQERRAQNRTAQKAFREREQQRKAEKEKQWEEYRLEIQELRNKLAIVQFEAKYLKACVLHLTLSCLVHRGSVPHIWTESRIIPSNDNGEYKKPIFGLYGQNLKEAYQTPALLDMLLENNCVVDFDKALFATTQNSSFSNFVKNTNPASDFAFSSYQSYIEEQVITINKKSQEPRLSFPNRKKKTKPMHSSEECQSLEQPSPQPAIYQPSPSAEIHVPSPPPSIYQNRAPSTSLEDIKSPPSGTSQALTTHRKPVRGVISEPPTLKTSEDFVNMPSLQALHILRLQLKLGSILGNMTPASLLPTALQRVIPHDIRIDFVPGASIRDRMILFQDYYNIDECFQFLTRKSVFMGGDIRDTRNWSMDPKYSLQFWFLSHLLVDQNYDNCIDIENVNIIAKEFMNYEDEDGNVILNQKTSTQCNRI